MGAGDGGGDPFLRAQERPGHAAPAPRVARRADGQCSLRTLALSVRHTTLCGSAWMCTLTQ